MLWGLNTSTAVLNWYLLLTLSVAERQQCSDSSLCSRSCSQASHETGEAISCIMITGCCSSHSHRQRDRQIWRDETYGGKCCKQTAQMGLQTYTRSVLSIAQSGKERTDTHTLSDNFILFSVDLAKAEAHHVVLMFGLRVSRCGFLLRRWT